MENLFQTIMYLLFGNKWVKYTMVQGMKVAVYVSEAEMEKERVKANKANRTFREKKEIFEEYKARTLEDFTLDYANMNQEALDALKVSDPKQHYLVTNEAKHSYKTNLQVAESEMNIAGGEVTKCDKEYQTKINTVVANREKLEFIKKYY